MDHPFSIVIPYHAHANTLDFARKQLNYYHVNSTQMTVILAISGDKKVISKLTEYLNNLKDPRFQYFTTEENDITNVVPYIQKIFDGLRLVKTPYVVINGIDDVIIPEEASKGTEILAKDHNIAGAKGYTVVYYCNSGKFSSFQDQEIMNDCPLERLKQAIKGLDSIFYIVRRTDELLEEYDNIVKLAKNSNTVGNSLYHIEHFLNLSITSVGKIYVMKSAWRLQSSHDDNHTSHTDASFLRVQLGVLDKRNYDWFKSVHKNMKNLNYYHYKFLWACHQITGMAISLKQIAYYFLYKKCGFLNTARIFSYFILNKLYILSKKIISNKKNHFQPDDTFVNTEEYRVLKEHYFSEKDIALIESAYPLQNKKSVAVQ